MADEKRIPMTRQMPNPSPMPSRVGPRSRPKPYSPSRGNFPVKRMDNDGRYMAGSIGPIQPGVSLPALED